MELFDRWFIHFGYETSVLAAQSVIKRYHRIQQKKELCRRTQFNHSLVTNDITVWWKPYGGDWFCFPLKNKQNKTKNEDKNSFRIKCYLHSIFSDFFFSIIGCGLSPRTLLTGERSAFEVINRLTARNLR